MRIGKSCWTALVVLTAFSVYSADYRVLIAGKEKPVETGIIGSGKYSEVALLNPSVHRAAVKYEEFDMHMPAKNIDNRNTYDEDQAKLRLFFKPSIRAWGGGRSRVSLVGEGRWKLAKTEDAALYSRSWKRNAYKVVTDVNISMPDNRAEIIVEGVFTNNGRNDCVVEFAPQFWFIRDKALTMMLPRQYSDFINGKQKNFSYGEKVELDNTKGRNYFWRKAAKDDHHGFIDYVSRERIPFTNSHVDLIDVFGFVQLPGKNTLVWDLKNAADTKTLQYLEAGWDDRTGDALAAWHIPLKRGETKKVKFRLITVKGLSRFDTLSDNMLVGYGVEKDRLKIEMAPLSSLGLSLLHGEVINARDKQVLIKQPAELAEMNPFNPGRMEWRSTVKFERSLLYPIKISLHTKVGNNLLLQNKGVIVP